MEAQAKRYYSKIPGAKFIFPDGVEIHFNYGFFDFKPEEYPGNYLGASDKDPRNGRIKAEIYQEELEAVLKQKGGNPLLFDQTQIQTLGAGPRPIPTDDPRNPGKNIADLARSEAEVSAQDQTLAGVKSRETGDVNAGVIATGGGDPNSSTIDHNLMKRVANFNASQDAAAQVGATGGSGTGNSAVDKIRADAAARAQQSVSKG